MIKLVPIKNLNMLAFVFLSLMLIALPNLEAPKNIFLVTYLLIMLIGLLKNYKNTSWDIWDWIFLSFIGSAFLSALFAGKAPAYEWRAFRSMFICALLGWIVSKAAYKKNELDFLFLIVILATLPGLLFGLLEVYTFHTKQDLQLHSVGHVNHSALYILITLGASLGYFLSNWKTDSLKKRALLFSLVAFLYTSLIIGASRAAFGMGLMMIIIQIFAIPNQNKFKLSMIGLLLLSFFMMFHFDAKIVQKQIRNQENHNVLAYRDVIWNTSLEAARFYPLFGIGNGNWKLITVEEIQASVEKRGEIFNRDKYMIKEAGHSHNLYLSWLVERGFLGLGVILFFMSSWLMLLIRNLQQIKSSKRAAYLWGASMSAWIGTFGVGLVNSTFHHETAIVAFLFLGLHLSFLKKTN
jgi:O-antigen ligase